MYLFYHNATIFNIFLLIAILFKIIVLNPVWFPILTGIWRFGDLANW